MKRPGRPFTETGRYRRPQRQIERLLGSNLRGARKCSCGHKKAGRLDARERRRCQCDCV